MERLSPRGYLRVQAGFEIDELPCEPPPEPREHREVRVNPHTVNAAGDDPNYALRGGRERGLLESDLLRPSGRELHAGRSHQRALARSASLREPPGLERRPLTRQIRPGMAFRSYW